MGTSSHDALMMSCPLLAGMSAHAPGQLGGGSHSEQDARAATLVAPSSQSGKWWPQVHTMTLISLNFLVISFLKYPLYTTYIYHSVLNFLVISLTGRGLPHPRNVLLKLLFILEMLLGGICAILALNRNLPLGIFNLLVKMLVGSPLYLEVLLPGGNFWVHQAAFYPALHYILVGRRDLPSWFPFGPETGSWPG